VFSYLKQAGLELEDVELSTTPCEDPSTMPGYDALLFIAGRLRR